MDGAMAGGGLLGVDPFAMLGGLFGQMGQNAGQQQANNQNMQMAREGMMFSADQAQKQMEFQERMSSTAHQREVADLRAAGLNPILSAHGGGSSTPSGASGQAQVPVMRNVNEGMASTALEIRRLSKDVKQAESSINLTNEQANTQKKQQNLISNQAKAISATAEQQKLISDYIKKHPNQSWMYMILDKVLDWGGKAGRIYESFRP